MHYPALCSASAGYGLNFYRARSLNFKLREWKKWNSLSVAPGTQAGPGAGAGTGQVNELSHGGAVCLAAAALGTGSQFDVTLAQLAFKAKTMLISSGFQRRPYENEFIFAHGRKKRAKLLSRFVGVPRQLHKLLLTFIHTITQKAFAFVFKGDSPATFFFIVTAHLFTIKTSRANPWTCLCCCFCCCS